MKYLSTNHHAAPASLKEAVLQGLAPDGGLYMPEQIPTLPGEFIKSLPQLSLQEIAFEVAKLFIDSEIPETKIKEIINDAINFEAPLKNVYPHIHSLELFHGPTLAFKDFGARFMARLMAFFLQDSKEKTYILAATSGDTGSAVGSGFLNVPGFEVIILYPSQKISNIQEKQLTTFGNNVTALEIQGTFDDCQKLVKEAFQDLELKDKINLSSANSINIARLIPQTFYYFYAYGQIQKAYPHSEIVFSVPTGNLGNLTAGIIAKKMGLPISKFIAAQNINNTFYNYLTTNEFSPKPSTLTISNAMDVGNPSNFARIENLYHSNPQSIHEDICAYYFSDQDTENAIRNTYKETGYILDPHGAVGLLALQKYLTQNPTPTEGIFLETAHPAKFFEAVEKNIHQKISLPEILSTTLEKEKKSKLMPPTFKDFKEFLLNL